MTALDRWREELGSWRIPDAILAAAPEPPWGFPTELFRRRAASAAAEAAEPTPTVRRAQEALPIGGSILDVGCGGGATSLPLAGRVGEVVGVDGQADMLRAFLEAAESAGVKATAVRGTWPEAGPEVGATDVVVCGHVLYNVAEAGPFVDALTLHARRRVVVEITGTHPMSWMHDLWERFYGVARPSGPTAEDAAAAIRQTGVEPRREARTATDDHPAGGGFERREDAVALVRRRLCLPAERDDEIEAALGDRLRERGGLWSAGPRDQELVTLWWDGEAARSPTTQS